MEKMKNSEKYPEAWEFYVEQARNIKEEPDLNFLGNYRIPTPNMTGDFIYADTVEQLWVRFIIKWFEPNINSHSIHGKIQYIVQNF